jgi:hypothetical protein
MGLRLAPELYDELVQWVFKRDEWKCRRCRFRRVEAHHIVFRSEGGPDTSWNLVSLCPSCHAAVHSGKLSIWSDNVSVGADGKLEFYVTNGWRPK